MEYADVIWDNCSEGEIQLLESVQYESARVLLVLLWAQVVGYCGMRLLLRNLVYGENFIN